MAKSDRVRAAKLAARKRKKFFALANRFRAATNPQEVARLGHELGRMMFGK
jgi:hypothetical protein